MDSDDSDTPRQWALRISRRPQRPTIDRLSQRIQHMEQRAGEAVLSLRGPVFGVDLGPALLGVVGVRAATLTRDDKVRVAGPDVLVEQACMARIAQAAASDEDAGLDAALYVLHELAHLPQGIGDYAVVQRLRAIDEGLVLDMDLAADHFAALVVAQIGWTELARLKDRQGRGLCNYPVGPDHAPAARLRKARRVVSLRADCLLRQRGLLASGAGYVSAAFGSERGLAVVEMGRGVSTLLACAELSPRAQAVLLGAADRAADVRAATARLDAVLYRLLPQLRRAA